MGHRGLVQLRRIDQSHETLPHPTHVLGLRLHAHVACLMPVVEQRDCVAGFEHGQLVRRARGAAPQCGVSREDSDLLGVRGWEYQDQRRDDEGDLPHGDLPVTGKL